MKRRSLLRGLGAGAAIAGLGLGRLSRAAEGHVLIAGGGFGGATCARYLRQLAPGLRVTLVDRHASLVTGPFCNTVVAGLNPLETITRDHRALAASGIDFIHAEIEAVDPAAKSVELTDGRRLSGDRLVVAPGIAFKTDDIEGYGPAVAETMPPAWPGGPEQLTTLRGQLRAMPDDGLVVIAPPPDPYRCPPGPYERASLIAWFLEHEKPRAKLLILDPKENFSKEALFRSGWAALYGDRIEWIGRAQGGRVVAVDAARRSVTTAGGERVQADVINLIPPQRAGALAQRAGLTNVSGWAPVDQRTFESTLYPGVHVVGDACIGAPMPKSAYAANSEAKVCAYALAAAFSGQPFDGMTVINACYSLVTPNYGIVDAAVYDYNGANLAIVPDAHGLSPLAADAGYRARAADYARSWYANITADSFGPVSL